MWWWGVCAGASCSTDVAVRPSSPSPPCSPPSSPASRRRGRRAPLYEDLRPLSVNSPARSSSAASVSFTGGDVVRPGVYTARHALTHELVAIKVLPRALLKDRATRRRLRRELRVLSRCRAHPNLLTLHGAHSSSPATVELAFELAKGGEVMNRFLAASSGSPGIIPGSSSGVFSNSASYRFSEAEVSRVIAACASGLAFLHDQRVVHGEVRPEHVLFSDGEPDSRVLIVGFGRAAPWDALSLRSSATSRPSRASKAPRYLWEDRRHVHFLPPFVLRRKRRLATSDAAVSGCGGICDWSDRGSIQKDHVDEANLVQSWREAQQIDVWALGVVTYMLLCAEYPFSDVGGGEVSCIPTSSSTEELEARILGDSVAFPITVTSNNTDGGSLRESIGSSSGCTQPLTRAARDFVLRLLEKDPRKAMSMRDVLAHPWISSQVASEVPWTSANLAKHQRFAAQYSMEVAVSHTGAGASGRRRATLGTDSGMDGVCVVVEDAGEPYRMSTRDADEEIDVNGDDTYYGRPSWVSTDGQELYLSEEEQQRPSAEAYMRLADDEMNQCAIDHEQVRTVLVGTAADDAFDPSCMSPAEFAQAGRQRSLDKMWQILVRQRRFFSFKSLSSSFNSSGKASDKAEARLPLEA